MEIVSWFEDFTEWRVDRRGGMFVFWLPLILILSNEAPRGSLLQYWSRRRCFSCNTSLVSPSSSALIIMVSQTV